MWILLLLAALPSLAVANLQCPLSCPEGKTCCLVGEKYSCCDDEKLEGYVLQGTVPQNTSGAMVQNAFGFCGYECQSQGGTCCTLTSCCPHSNAACCSDRMTCCPSGNTCCSPGCCASGAKCCSFGCCRQDQECCLTGCCESGYRCCGSWCCKKPHRCGIKPHTCSGAIFSPAAATLLFLVAASLRSKFFFL